MRSLVFLIGLLAVGGCLQQVAELVDAGSNGGQPFLPDTGAVRVDGGSLADGGASDFGPPASISCVPLVLEFGTVAANLESVLPVECTNVGGATVTYLRSEVQGDFQLSMDPAPVSLGPGDWIQLDVGYQPTMTEMTSGRLDLIFDDGEVAVISLAGAAIAEFPCNYTLTPEAWQGFGDVKVGTIATAGFTITNLGPNECLVTGLQTNCPDGGSAFTLAAVPVTSQRLSPPGPNEPYPSSLQIDVEFSPQEVGPFTCDVRFNIDNTPDPTVTIPLAGVGVD